MSKTGIKWNAERLLSLSAMSMSFFTLLIFVYQTNLLRKQNYISILPYMDISTTNSEKEHTFEINLKNLGDLAMGTPLIMVSKMANGSL